MAAHPQIVPTAEMIDDPSVLKPIPMNVLNYEVLPGGLYHQQEAPVYSRGGYSAVGAANPTSNDDGIAR